MSAPRETEFPNRLSTFPKKEAFACLAVMHKTRRCVDAEETLV